MTSLKRYFFCCLFLLFSTPLSQANPATDVLIFSPHPDDETLACAGTILKALQENKKVKIVFLTNGEAYSTAASAWLNKKPEKLTPDDYIALGEMRKKEAMGAAAKLGLQQEDVIFLSYPDGELSALWRQKAIKGPGKENLLKDIKGILNDCQAKRAYLPHPLDKHSDHKATTLFVYQALKELTEENKLRRAFPLRISYYLIHRPEGGIFQASSRQEDIARFKQRKAEILQEYVSQLNIENEKDFLFGFIQDKELFWDLPENKEIYLKSFQEEWLRIAENMRSQGYNLNLGPVADVAMQIEDTSFPLAAKQRVYSDNPQNVTEIVSALIRATAKGGLTSVVKHFPGLGPVYADTHLSLVKTGISQEELFARDLVPFQKIIENYPDTWIMINHAVYSSFSDKPASLSFEIQTELLRKKMGFKGIIVVDELLGMQAIEEYASLEKINEPYIGEIVARAFKAGADIALIFPSPENAVSVVSGVIESVKKALKDGRLLQKDIDVSVERILKDKERIFGIPLVQWLGELTLEEKIMQKIMIDAYQEISIFKKYNLGGVYARDSAVIDNIRLSAKIPLFVAGQNEGGLVSQPGINTRSAYVVGSELEWLASETLELVSQNLSVGKQIDPAQQKIAALSCDKLDKCALNQIAAGLMNFMDDLIKQWRKLNQEGKASSVHPNYLSPLVFFEDRLEVRPFKDAPLKWRRRFLNQNSAFCAYQLLKNVFDDWAVGQGQCSVRGEVVSLLESFQERLKLIETKEDKSEIRILCLAAHPDDEDAQALAYFKKRFNCETYVLLATRGEGGENEISSLLYDELGALRTAEMEKSASVLGVDKVYYLGKKDFGYCVNPDEALLKWGKEDTLKKLVYFLRLIKPHIIITKHSKLSSFDRHGQHKALISLAQEAFDSAGENTSYPEMLKDGLPPWSPLKFYQRAEKSESLMGSLVIDPQVYIIPENKTVQQIANEALIEHHSQGSGQWLSSSKIDKITYQLIKSRVSLKGGGYFFEGINPDFTEQKKSRASGKNVWSSGIPGIKIVQGLNIGLVDGNKRILVDALNTLGCDFKNLDDQFIAGGDLSRFEVIILGEGAYSSSAAIIQARKRMLGFVEQGGNLIILSQRPWAKSFFSDSPYRLQERFNPISDENMPVNILKPAHPLINFPNKISEVDFAGWKQERGLYFPAVYADEFVELLGCLSDQGEQIKGGYLVLDHGKGSIIYTGYSWVRQLRESHFGAFKNLSNMLSYSHREK